MDLRKKEFNPNAGRTAGYRQRDLAVDPGLVSVLCHASGLCLILTLAYPYLVLQHGFDALLKVVNEPRNREPRRLDSSPQLEHTLSAGLSQGSLEGGPPEDKEIELRFKAKIRAVHQSACCAGQPRGSKKNAGQFGSSKPKKKRSAASDIVVEPAPSIEPSDLAAAIQQLDIAYKAALKDALDQATSQFLHQIQSSADDLPDQRGQAALLWQQATASVSASMEMVTLPTLQEAVHKQPAPMPKPIKRTRVIDTVVLPHKADRRGRQGNSHDMRDAQREGRRTIADELQLSEDTAIALELQKKVKDDLHFSERRLVAIAAYYEARASGIRRRGAMQGAARSMAIGLRTMERWVAKYLSEGEGFFESSRWGAHSKTPYLLADKTLQQAATVWVRGHAARHKDEKGEAAPNMKVEDFQDYLNAVLIPNFVAEWGDTVDFRQSIIRRNANADPVVNANPIMNTGAAPGNANGALVEDNSDGSPA